MENDKDESDGMKIISIFYFIFHHPPYLQLVVYFSDNANGADELAGMIDGPL